MCGRTTLRTPLTVLLRQFATELAPETQFSMRYNLAPTQSIPVVRMVDSKRQLLAMHWGLVPSWAKDPKIGYSTINARAATEATNPAFRFALKKRRCLVIADGYYEWRPHGKIKQPYLCELDGGKAFAFATHWEQWWGAGQKATEPLECCSIITTDANVLADKIYDRMPMLLDEQDFDAWLNPANQDGESLRNLFEPFPVDRMSVRPVSTYVNNARHEGLKCMNI